MVRALILVTVTAACATLDARASGRLTAQPSTLSLVYLYDMTVGVPQRPPPLAGDKQLERSLGLVASNLKNGDTLRVGLISRRLHLGRTFTSGETTNLFSHVVQSVTAPDSERIGPAALWDGLYEAIEVVAVEGGHRAVIVMTTGESIGGNRTIEEVVSRAGAASVSISSIFAAWPESAAAMKRYEDYWSRFPVSPSETLKTIAIGTGGWYQAPKEGASGDLKRRVKDVFTALRR
jgi:hypothetical protein